MLCRCQDSSAVFLFAGGTIKLKELTRLVSHNVTKPEADSAEELAEMFRMYDKDGRGYVAIQDMKHVLTSVGEKMTDVEADDLLKLSGAVDRGMVNYQSK